MVPIKCYSLILSKSGLFALLSLETFSCFADDADSVGGEFLDFLNLYKTNTQTPIAKIKIPTNINTVVILLPSLFSLIFSTVCLVSFLPYLF